MADGYAIRHVRDFDEMEGSGGSTWRLARRALGVESFGFNVVDIAPGGQIPEHDEGGSGQDEVYIVLEGEATVRAGGEESPAPAGTFVAFDPATTRTILNRSEAPVRALLIGVSPDGGYSPLEWA